MKLTILIFCFSFFVGTHLLGCDQPITDSSVLSSSGESYSSDISHSPNVRSENDSSSSSNNRQEETESSSEALPYSSQEGTPSSNETEVSSEHHINSSSMIDLSDGKFDKMYPSEKTCYNITVTEASSYRYYQNGDIASISINETSLASPDNPKDYLHTYSYKYDEYNNLIERIKIAEKSWFIYDWDTGAPIYYNSAVEYRDIWEYNLNGDVIKYRILHPMEDTVTQIHHYSDTDELEKIECYNKEDSLLWVTDVVNNSRGLPIHTTTTPASHYNGTGGNIEHRILDYNSRGNLRSANDSTVYFDKSGKPENYLNSKYFYFYDTDGNYESITHSLSYSQNPTVYKLLYKTFTYTPEGLIKSAKCDKKLPENISCATHLEIDNHDVTCNYTHSELRYLLSDNTLP
ncbi:MAG: hypothetical protein OCC49_19955 [Fibrobacterales bacterium]